MVVDDPPPGSGQLVCRLKKSLYGLKQASRQWYLKFSQVLSGSCVYAGLLGCKPASTPMDSIKQLQMDAGPPLDDPTANRRLIGRLVYLYITRPDITFAVNKLSQFLSKPCLDHSLAAERVLRYLKGTIGHGLFYSAQADISPSIFSEADWAGCPDTRRSISGFCLFIDTSLIC
ncbi:hypothetical protein SASPL_137928 [Salvia splendens]|uniref:Reverse transcriptase Ty1/copia-type domain-containing protein n=1 Tax=Salvia splendens TaxID=180675 RepID=A0A8X8ZDW8_SALSN|nr:hypothetical protein SASPL_137928 [Salvia splendens]